MGRSLLFVKLLDILISGRFPFINVPGYYFVSRNARRRIFFRPRDTLRHRRTARGEKSSHDTSRHSFQIVYNESKYTEMRRKLK